MPFEQASAAEESGMKLALLSLAAAVSPDLQAWGVVVHKGPYMMGAVMMGAQETMYWQHKQLLPADRPPYLASSGLTRVSV